jgi:hypothetical protein
MICQFPYEGKTMNAFWKNVVAIAVGGGLSSLAAAGIDPITFNFSSDGLRRLLGVFLVGAVTAVIHLYQTPPAASSSASNGAQKVGVLALCALILSFSMVGCSQQAGVTIAQDIDNWTPALVTAVNTITATGAMLDPVASPIFSVATAGFDAAATLVKQYADAYLKNPSASVLVNLQTAVMTLQQSANQALLQAAGIKDASSQKLALSAINGVATIVAVLLGLVQTISSKAELRTMRDAAGIKYAAVRRLMDGHGLEQAASSQGVTVDGFFGYEARAGF